MCLDHQHFLTECDLSTLDWPLRLSTMLMRPVVYAHCWRQVATVVSSFYLPPLRRGREHVTRVGPLLRPEVASAQSTRQGYLLSYLRPNTPTRVIELLAATGRPTRVYGLGEREPHGCLQFCPIDQQQFVLDLANCEALIGAAGNQTLGEALHLGKPVLALPERRHHEQRINSHFLQQMGAGDYRLLESITATDLAAFLEQLDDYHQQLSNVCGRLDGTTAAETVLRRHLPTVPEKNDISTTHSERKAACAVGRASRPRSPMLGHHNRRPPSFRPQVIHRRHAGQQLKLGT